MKRTYLSAAIEVAIEINREDAAVAKMVESIRQKQAAKEREAAEEAKPESGEYFARKNALLEAALADEPEKGIQVVIGDDVYDIRHHTQAPDDWDGDTISVVPVQPLEPKGMDYEYDERPRVGDIDVEMFAKPLEVGFDCSQSPRGKISEIDVEMFAKPITTGFAQHVDTIEDTVIMTEKQAKEVVKMKGFDRFASWIVNGVKKIAGK